MSACPEPTQQGAQNRTISSLLFVDVTLDISTSYAGIQDRAGISNYFTGQSASGSVFGADKSFLFYLSPRAHPDIAHNDGLGIPQPIRVIASSEGFRHLGIHQGTDNQWEETTREVWQRLSTQVDAPRGLGKKELQYIVNSVWIRVFSTVLPSVMPLVPSLDTLFRKTARRVLKLPHDHPTEWFYDPTDGLGLAYQLVSGLTYHPPAFRIPPPAADATLLGTILRDLAIFKPALTITTLWHQPADSLPLRPNDRPIWAYLTPALGTTLISINRLHAKKVRWVGDITNDKGTMLLSLASNLRTKFGWTSLTLQCILAGLHQSGDAALQICDNTKSIGLVVLTRSLKHRGGLPRYSNIHRVELRSLMALFTDTRTFTDDWIRLHKDMPDPILRTKPTLLAEADSLATLAHQLLPLTNYAHLIIPDSWELRGEHDRPVTRATAPWRCSVYGRGDWLKAQAQKPDTRRRTVQPLRLPTGDICKWDPPALNLYW
ncbi:hypothetical protein DYB28_005529, partial [Aphanomyces astaci]